MLSATTDRGATWSHDTLDSLFRAQCFAFDLADPNKVYLAGDTYYSQPMFRVSTDLGQTWEERRNGLAGSVVTVACVPRRPDVLFCGSGSGLYKTTNGGLDWARKGTFTAVRSIVVDSVNADVVYAGTYTGVHVSTDAGETWFQMNAGLLTNEILCLALRSGPNGALFCGTNGRGAFVTDPLVAVEETMNDERGTRNVGPTIVRGSLVLSRELSAGSRQPVVLLDATGRKVMELKPGPNDVRRVPAGVYFVRTETADKRPNARTAKVVIR